MNDTAFDLLTRHGARGITRRGSLGMVGATGLALLARRQTVDARPQGKRRRNRNNAIKKKADQKCAAQADQCLDRFSAECDGDQECLLLALRCCPFAGECDVVGFITCQAEVNA